MGTKSILAVFVFLAMAAGARAEPAARGQPIQLGDVPGSSGRWQEGRSVIAAPEAEVRGWLTGFQRWPERFGDITYAKVIDKDNGVTTVRFKSRIIGREMTIRLKQTGEGVVYDGTGKNVTTQGKIFIKPIDEHHTEVIMQASSEVHGLSGAFATQGLKRKRALQKMQSDLRALQAMADGRASM